jgi:hypothetical protein
MGVWALCIPFDTLQCPFKCPQNVIFSEVLYLNTRTFLYVPPRMRARTTVTTPMSIWEPQKAGMPCLNIVGELKAKSAKQEGSGLEIYPSFSQRCYIWIPTEYGTTIQYLWSNYSMDAASREAPVAAQVSDHAQPVRMAHTSVCPMLSRTECRRPTSDV